MGGKTVMMSALLYPERIEKLVVVDAAPTLSKSMGEVKTYLDKMISMDMSLYTKRKEIEKELQTVAKVTWNLIKDCIRRLYFWSLLQLCQDLNDTLSCH